MGRLDCVLHDTEDMTEEEFLQARREGIGGSDMGTIAGLNPYGSKYELWLKKTGQIEPDTEGNKFTEFGNRAEPMVADWAEDRLKTLAGNPCGRQVDFRDDFMEELSEDLRVQNRFAMQYHPDREWHIINVDREIVNSGMGLGILEVKTTHPRNYNDWFTDDGKPTVPAYYVCQVQHYLAAPWYDWAAIAVMVDRELLIRVMEPDEDLIDDLADLGRDFWENNVQAEVAPDVDGSDSAKKALSEKYSDLDEETHRVEDEEEREKILDLLSARDELKAEKDELEDQISTIDNQLLDLAGERKKLVVPDDEGNERKVTQVRYSREYLDKKAVKNEFPEVEEQRDKFFNESETHYVKVT